MANNFTYYAPTEVIFGRNVEEETGKQLKRLGASHVLLVYGGNSARRSGLLDKVRHSLSDEAQKRESVLWNNFIIALTCL